MALTYGALVTDGLRQWPHAIDTVTTLVASPKPRSTGELVVISGAATRKVPSELG